MMSLAVKGVWTICVLVTRMGTGDLSDVVDDVDVVIDGLILLIFLSLFIVARGSCI